MHELFNRYPKLRQKLAIASFANLPTPIETMPALQKKLGTGELFLKSDNQSAEKYGGNKIRKLEFLLGDAQARGFAAVLTYGAAGSHHALATSVFARETGLDCYAVLTDQPATTKIKETLLYHQLLQTRLVAAPTYADMQNAARAITQEESSRGRTVYDITFGGSDPLGAVGFVNAGLELAAQVDAGLLPEPQRIYIACGSTGSVAGLLLGLTLAGLKTTVVAVQVTVAQISGPACIEKLCRETNRLLNGLSADIPIVDEPLKHLEFRDEFFGGEYALATPGALDAVKLLQETEGVSLETTYTGKAMAALLTDARANKLQKGFALFWNSYNSQPYPLASKNADWTSLPKAFHHYFSRPE
jgi:D-cysteine desulfhydrase